MEPLLAEKTAVITGGSSGIGRGIVRSFAREGASLVIADIQEEPNSGGVPTNELVRDEFEMDATFVDCDVSKVSDHSDAVSAADEFGGIDVTVNNAAVFFTEDFRTATGVEFDRLMNVNAKGPYFGCQQAVNAMVENRGGSIINLSSVNGIMGGEKAPLYCMSKAAVKLLTCSIAAKFGSEDNRINAIHPGSIEAMMSVDHGEENPKQKEAFLEQIALGRQRNPTEIGDVAVFLASDLSRYITGQSITVDGGWITHT